MKGLAGGNINKNKVGGVKRELMKGNGVYQKLGVRKRSGRE